MANTIARNFDDINKLIKEIKNSAGAAAREAGTLDKALKIDPNNVQLATQKLDNLDKRIKQGKVDLDAMRAAQRKFTAEGGDVNSAEYQKLNNQIITTEAQMKKLTRETQALNKEFASGKFSSFNQGLTSMNSKLETMKGKVEGVSRVAKAALATIAAMMTAYIKVGDELDDTSKKWGVSAENLQLNRNLYDKLTDSANNYDKALSGVASIQSSIAKGRGAAYIETLNKLGVAYTDVNGVVRSASDIYEDIVSSLRNVTDANERAGYAVALFGENGLNVETIAMQTTEAIDQLNNAYAANGLITTDQAAAAGAAADKIADMKQQVLVMTATFGEDLMPILMQFFGFLQSTAIPTINNLFGWFINLSDSEKKVVLGILVGLAILPKFIAAIQMVNVALMFLSANPVILVIFGIIVAIWLLIKAWQALQKALGKNVDASLNADQQLSNLTSQQQTITQATTVTKSEELNVKLQVEVKSDQPISETMARQIVDDIVPIINRELARKVQAR